MSGDGVKTNHAQRLKDRLREPSTWAGIAAVAAAVGGHPELAVKAASAGDSWAHFFTVFGPGLAAILLPEARKG